MPMAKKDDVLNSALQLSAEERAEVAGRLLLSLEDEPPEDPASVAAAWDKELLRRVEALRSGGADTVDAFEELERLERELELPTPKR